MRQEVQRHSVSIAQMGNFEHTVAMKRTLRDPFSEMNDSKKVNFGSPFKKRKKSMKQQLRDSTNKKKSFLTLSIDEADLGLSNSTPASPEPEQADQLKLEPERAQDNPNADLSDSYAGPPSSMIQSMFRASSVEEQQLQPQQHSLSRSITPSSEINTGSLALGQQKLPLHSHIDEAAIVVPTGTQPALEKDSVVATGSAEKIVTNGSLDEHERTVLQWLSSISTIQDMPDELVANIYEHLNDLYFAQINAKLKDSIARIIRHPMVKDGSSILSKLETMKGSVAAKRKYVDNLCEYASAFKKRKITQDLREAQKKMLHQQQQREH